MPELEDPWWLNLPPCHACRHLASRHRAGILMHGLTFSATFKQCQFPGCQCQAYRIDVTKPRSSFQVFGFDPNKKEKP